MSRPKLRHFDHLEALERFRGGETAADIARRYGVSQQAVSSALHRLVNSGRGEIGGSKVEEMLSKCRG